MDSVHRKKKSVCLKYANVVLLLYDALNLTDNFLALLWWSLLLRVTGPRACSGTPPWPDSLGQEKWLEEQVLLISPPLCSTFKLYCLKNEYNTFCLLSVRTVPSSLRPLCLPGRGTLSSPVLSFPPLGIIVNPPHPWALLSFIPVLSGALPMCGDSICKVIYTSLYNCSKETGRKGLSRGWLISGWWKGWSIFPIKLIKLKQNTVTKMLHKACHSG